MRKICGDKKGQGLQLSTIILIVLGIAVLVFLIFGFSTGWGNFWNRITNFAGSSNVDTLVSACEVACMQQARSDFCETKRDIRLSDGYTTNSSTCYEIATDGKIVGTKGSETKEFNVSLSTCGSLCN